MAAGTLSVDDVRARLGPLGVTEVRRLAGGASSLTFLAVDAAGTKMVVKAAPPGVAPVLHRDVLRQARLMQALAPTAVPVPAVLHQDPGRPPEVPPLFVMEYVEGVSLEPLFDLDAGRTDGDAGPTVGARARHAATTLAALHSVDPADVGLADEPVVGPVAEVDRWSDLLETVDQSLVPGWPAVASMLRQAEPAPWPRPAVVHGDFRLGNLLAVDERIVSVIDWEIWSLGDPRVDLGWFVLNADPDTYRRPTPYAAAMPAPADLVSVYAAALGADPVELRWFTALAAFKSAATWSLIVKHNRRRAAPDPAVEAMVGDLERLLVKARRGLAAPRSE